MARHRAEGVRQFNHLCSSVPPSRQHLRIGREKRCPAACHIEQSQAHRQPPRPRRRARDKQSQAPSHRDCDHRSHIVLARHKNGHRGTTEKEKRASQLAKGSQRHHSTCKLTDSSGRCPHVFQRRTTEKTQARRRRTSTTTKVTAAIPSKA